MLCIQWRACHFSVFHHIYRQQPICQWDGWVAEDSTWIQRVPLNAKAHTTLQKDTDAYESQQTHTEFFMVLNTNVALIATKSHINIFLGALRIDRMRLT